MKKNLLLSLMTMVAVFSTNAQSIINGNFEEWSTISMDRLTGISSSHNISKSTDKTEGQFSIKLETKTIDGDTRTGYFLFGKFEDGPEGGVAYTQRPDSIVGFVKHDIMPGDTALILATFWDNDMAVSFDVFKFIGVQANFTRFSFPLMIGAMSVDSVTLAATSSNALTEVGVQAGSWIIFDDIKFAGAAVTEQLSNTNFENWTLATAEDLDAWYTFNAQIFENGYLPNAEKTSDAYAGNYALKLTTISIKEEYVNSITNGKNSEDTGYYGGQPFSNTIDTLFGYYKYSPVGNDTAVVALNFSQNGIPVGYMYKTLLAASSYTYFEIPIYFANAPDTMRIDISSSNWPVDSSTVGSVLIIDEVQLKSQLLNTGLAAINVNTNSSVFPNPFTEIVNIQFTSNVAQQLSFQIYNVEGKLVSTKNTHATIGNNQFQSSAAHLSSGLYHYVLKGNEGVITSGNIIK